MIRRTLFAAVGAALALAPAPSTATAAVGHALCREAGLEAAARHGVPQALMLAIGEVESGRGGKGAWPWALNMGGKGAWFDTRAQALAAAEAALTRGVRSIDLGCFQVNRHWHGAAFDGLDQMLDPHANADYAARFLAKLHAEAGDWPTAAGWYHSRTPRHASRYRALVAAAKGRIAERGPRVAAAAAAQASVGSAFGRALFGGAASGAPAGKAGAVRLSALRQARPLLGEGPR